MLPGGCIDRHHICHTVKNGIKNKGIWFCSVRFWTIADTVDRQEFTSFLSMEILTASLGHHKVFISNFCFILQFPSFVLYTFQWREWHVVGSPIKSNDFTSSFCFCTTNNNDNNNNTIQYCRSSHVWNCHWFNAAGLTLGDGFPTGSQ